MDKCCVIDKEEYEKIAEKARKYDKLIEEFKELSYRNSELQQQVDGKKIGRIEVNFTAGLDARNTGSYFWERIAKEENQQVFLNIENGAVDVEGKPLELLHKIRKSLEESFRNMVNDYLSKYSNDLVKTLNDLKDEKNKWIGKTNELEDKIKRHNQSCGIFGKKIKL